MLRIALPLLLLAPLAAQKPLAGEARTQLLKQVEVKMSKVQHVSAAFTQEKHDSLFGDVLKSKGHILYGRPDKLRWEYRAPFQSILIVAGDDVAKFEIEEGKRRRLELGKTKDVLLVVMEQIRSWFRGDFTAAERHYDVKVFAEPARVTLTPKDKALKKTLASIELAFAKDLQSVTRVTIREASGDHTVMSFVDPEHPKTLEAATFDTKDPASIESIVDKPTSRKSGRR